jgi:cobalamin biosynthesis Mg chelatase CobN
MSGARRARLAALGAAGLLAALTLVTGAALAQEPAGPGTEPTTTLPTTTTTIATTTTTVPTTTTTFRSTSTTAQQQTATTAERVETTTTTTLEVTTSIDVLVPGDGTEGAESTTTTTQTPTTISNDGTSDATLLTLIVGGLVLLAVAVSILTWRYWAATRPPMAPTVGSDHG